MRCDSDLAGQLSWSYTMLEAGDPSTAETLVFSEKDILGIGTDPDEGWAGEPTFAMNAQVPEMDAAGMRFQQGDIQAFNKGSVNWAADQPTPKLADGGEMPMRLPSVWHREGDAGKMVQFHVSSGVSKMKKALGEELTTGGSSGHPGGADAQLTCRFSLMESSWQVNTSTAATRSDDAGVLGGFAEYFDVEPSLVSDRLHGRHLSHRHSIRSSVVSRDGLALPPPLGSRHTHEQALAVPSSFGGSAHIHKHRFRGETSPELKCRA